MSAPLLVHAKAIGPKFTFFVVYGPVTHLVDVRAVEVAEREFDLLSSKEVNTAVKKHLRRKLVVVGACIGTDAHTVGIDAILNIKGFAGERAGVLPRTRRPQPRRPSARPRARQHRPGTQGRRRPRQPGRDPARRPHPQHHGHVGGLPRGLPRGQVPLLVVGGPASRRDRLALWVSTASSVVAPRPVRWPAISSTPSSPRPPRSAREPEMSREDLVGTTVTTVGTCPTRTPITPATSSTAPTPGRVRRRRHGGVHSYRRRRGAFRVLLRRPVQGSRPRRRLPGDRSPDRPALGTALGMEFEVRVIARGNPERSESADVLDPPIVATTARGVVVVPSAG